MRVSDRASPGRFPPSFPSIVTSTCGEAHAEVGAADVRRGRPGHTVGRARATHRRGVLSVAFAARASVRRAPQVGRLGPATTRPRRTPRDPLSPPPPPLPCSARCTAATPRGTLRTAPGHTPSGTCTTAGPSPGTRTSPGTGPRPAHDPAGVTHPISDDVRLPCRLA